MALSIIPAGEAFIPSMIRVLVYGQPGLGKSSFGFTCKNAIVLDFDGGSHRSYVSTNATKVRIGEWSDLQALKAQTNNYDGFDTIVIDTVSKSLEYLTMHLTKMNPKNGNNAGGLSPNGWGALASAFGAWITELTATGCDVVMIAQEVEDKEGEQNRKRPKVQGKQALGIVLENADFVGYAHAYGDGFAIGFRPTPEYYAKDSAGLGLVRVPDYAVSKTFGGDLLDTMKTAFRDRAQSQVEAGNAVDTWSDTVDGWTTAEEFNAALPQLKELTGAIKVQVSQMVRTRAKALGLTVDKDTKQYVAEVTT